MKESYDKRLNILIHRIKEDVNQAWEKSDETVKMFQIDDVDYVDIHRLPQHPLKKNGKTVHRSITVKLLTMKDKNLIFKSAKHLKKYSTERRTEDDVSTYTYITDHLPVKFQTQRKRLPFYKEAKQNKQKAVSKIFDEEYTLFVNNKKIDLSIQQD